MDSIRDKKLPIRRAEADDIPFIAGCIRESIENSVPAEERKLSDLWIDTTVAIALDSLSNRKMNDEVFVLSEGKECFGMLWLGRSADQYTCEETGYILGIYISPEYRRKGLGTELLGYAEKWCTDSGLMSLALDVGYENAEARSFYAENGYAPRSSVLKKHLL